jgi:hypothetical protein
VEQVDLDAIDLAREVIDDVRAEAIPQWNGRDLQEGNS